MSEYFQNSLDHIMAELSRIELKLQLKMMTTQPDMERDKEDKLAGLYLSKKEIESIFERNKVPSQPDEPAARLVDSLTQLEENISNKKRESLLRGIALRLENLRLLFQLSAFDVDTILLCLLPEIDLRYQRLYSYLQDDVTQKNPAVNLVLELLCNSYSEALKARVSFSSSAPLIRNQLVHLDENYPSLRSTLLAKSLRIEERIVHYLLEIDEIDARLLQIARLIEPKIELGEIVLPDELNELINSLVIKREEKIFCHFYGDSGVGKKSAAEAMCLKLGVPMLYVDLKRVIFKDGGIETLVPLILREGALQNAALYVDGYDAVLIENDHKSDSDYLLLELKKYPQWVFIATNKEWRPKENWQERPFVSIEFPVPSFSMRQKLWEKFWDKNTVAEKDLDFSSFASKFRLTGGQIRNVTINARNHSRLGQPGNGTVTTNELSSLCRNESREVLNEMAHKIQPKYSWNDIILPPDLFEQLKEIYGYVKHYYKVYSEWGFEKKLSLGKGLNALFSGPSGTGKTMAAEIIAHELQLDLYKIDLSTVVSKYIGETEKNLNLIFKEGQASNAILFFDEADAIFGKRSEVKDAHDRYANIEIAYLLQKMDEYDGMVILATNLRKNIDDAFSRRMHFTLEFPIPDESDRKRIWHNIFPSEAPLGDDIDFDFVAKQFQITGGNIKNIALGAAFLAAQNGQQIHMSHIVHAIKREYQKMGKLCTADEFTKYLEMVK
jgi:ATP-dependent 26S proteasome regulatory subunit